MQTFGIAPPNHLRNRRTAERRRQAQLVAAGEEHAVALLDVVEVLLLLAIPARQYLQSPRVLDTELAKQLLVIASGLLELGSGRDDRYARSLAAADLDETIQDLGTACLFFTAANGNDVAAIGVITVVI